MQEVHPQDDRLTGEMQFRYGYDRITGDQGRFRQDQWRSDQSRAGLESLLLQNRPSDPNDYHWIVQGRALYPDNYDLSFLINKHKHYLRFDTDGLRRYRDGSIEPWNSPIPALREKPDSDLFTDRRNHTLELGWIPNDSQQLVVGWHRWGRDGKTVRLQGAQGIDTLGATVSSIPVIALFSIIRNR